MDGSASPPLPVLLVAHQSPPLAGPGVRRVTSFVRAWPDHGLAPLLLTAPAEDGARFHGYPVLPGSEADLGAAPVLRVPTGSPRGLAGWLARTTPPRVAWTLCHRALREPETPWGAAALEAGLPFARAHGARVVVSSSQPYEAHLVGRAIARALGLPWVADFRDPMTEAEGRHWPTHLHRWRERREERRLFHDADLVWATCAAAAGRWRERFPQRAGHIRVRRNGVGTMPPDARDARPAPPPLRIGHVGRFTDPPEGRGAGSRLRCLDVSSGRGAGTGSNPTALFAGLARFLAQHPEARGQVVFVTAGPHTPAQLAAPPGVVVEAHGVLANAHALAVASTCQALFLPLTTPPRHGTQFVQQKAYEYGALGRPVLVVGHACETTELLGPLARRVPRGPEVAAGVAAVLVDLWRAGPLVPSPRPVPTQAGVAARCAKDLRALVEGRVPPPDHTEAS